MSRFMRGDSVEIMANFPDNSIDFILTDPPYLVGFKDRSGRSIAGDVSDDWVLPAIGLLCDMFIVMLIVAGALWLLVRHLKKGQGTWWLMNFLYWYLPTALLRLQFRRVPDSGNRHWMQ
ncbi:type IV conjugative transfer system protein TraL [Pantoea agglomerans]|uniref:type IV conjugative transfer system protein TraL n=1 Tax=Enterobacter agglomerans TaxID=549 RepID=UPI003C7D858A